MRASFPERARRGNLAGPVEGFPWSPSDDAFGVYYARELAASVLAGLPVALAYLVFQRRVTDAVTLSAGIKG